MKHTVEAKPLGDQINCLGCNTDQTRNLMKASDSTKARCAVLPTALFTDFHCFTGKSTSTLISRVFCKPSEPYSNFLAISLWAVARRPWCSASGDWIRVESKGTYWSCRYCCSQSQQDTTCRACWSDDCTMSTRYSHVIVWLLAKTATLAVLTTELELGTAFSSPLQLQSHLS